MLVIVPAWNEEETLPAVLAEIRHALPGIAVLVVDDGSVDGTARVAEETGVLVAHLPINLGVGAAMRTGFRYASRNGYAVAVQIDADGQHNPEDVPALLALLDAGANIAIGARMAGEGAYTVRGPRRWAMKLLSSVISRIAHARLTDTTSGFKACDARAIDLFAQTYPAEYLGDPSSRSSSPPGRGCSSGRWGCTCVPGPAAPRHTAPSGPRSSSAGR